MPGLQAARKQGSKAQAAQQHSAAEAPQAKEFGADLEFHALRLLIPAEQAELDTQSGLDGSAQQQR